MAFDYDELNPTGASFIANFPQNEQDFRGVVRDSASIDHWAEEGPTTPGQDGMHKKVSLPPLATKPTTGTDEGFVYTKDVDGLTELFYENEDADEVQLTSANSASPDKVAIAGDTMTGPLVMEAADLTVNDADILLTGTALMKLMNTLAIQGQDFAEANWRNLIGVDGSDVCDVGDQSLDGGVRLNADSEDSAVVGYNASDKKIWHAGHFANAPLFTQVWESDPIVFVTGASRTEGIEPHGLGSQPGAWSATLRCISANLNYGIGAEIPLSMGHSEGGAGGRWIFQIIILDAENFGWFAPESAIAIKNNDASGDNALIDETKWRLIIYAWY